MEAIILAGGFATRLHPLTLNRAKPLLEVAGKPAVEHILERLFPLAERGLTRIVVVSSERFAEDFRFALTGPYPIPVEIFSNGTQRPEEKLGAIGDINFGARHVTPGVPFFVLAGDNLFDFRLEEVLWAYEDKSLVVLHRVNTLEEVKPYNNLRLDGTGRILTFFEKPEKPFSKTFATCIYLFPPHVHDRLEEYLADGRDPDKAGDFIRWLSQHESVQTVVGDGTWFDIGTVAALAQAEAHFAGK
jgi:glucose-1-phosphate thymidylyltransferase